jgi:flagellin FlaB
MTHPGHLRLSGQRGITGLETAIVLIAFVVVASVFAYTVLTAGIFASQKSNEAVNAAIDEVRSTVTLSGSTIAYTGSVDVDSIATSTADRTDAVVRTEMTISVALNGIPLDVTPAYRINAANQQLERSGGTNSMVVNYLDGNQMINNAAWTVTFSGSNDGDFSLEPTEKAIISVWTVEYTYDNDARLYYHLGTGANDSFIDTKAELLANYDNFSLEVSPVQGAPLVIEKIIPQSLNEIMNLR